MADDAPLRLSAAKRAALRTRSIRVQALAQSKLYLGVKEHPPSSNRGPHIDRWCRWANGLTGYPWCAAFAVGMIREVSGLIVPEPRRASVGFLESWAKSVGYLVKKPRAGDFVCYRFDADNWPDHVGIVDKVYAASWDRDGNFVGSVRAVEGNTAAGDDANGGQVQLRYRSGVRCRFIRVDRKKLRRPG